MNMIVSVIFIAAASLNTTAAERKSPNPSIEVKRKQVPFEKILIKRGLNHIDPRYKLLLLDWQKTD